MDRDIKSIHTQKNHSPCENGDYGDADHWLLWNDCELREPAFNVAVDDLILENINEIGSPVLRIFRWDRPCVTFGRNQDFPDNIDEKYRVLRRSTGGGVVFHDNDLTYSLIFPMAHPILRLNRLESYRIIHEALSAKFPINSELKPEATAIVDRKKMRCFESPSRFDIVDAKGNKFAGAAQRRTRKGLLHQGSIILSVTEQDHSALIALILDALSKQFKIKFKEWLLPPLELEIATQKAEEFYLQKEWNHTIRWRTQLNN